MQLLRLESYICPPVMVFVFLLHCWSRRPAGPTDSEYK